MSTRTSLFRKYVLFFSALMGGALLISGLLSIHYSYQENMRALVKLQQEKADAAAAAIGQYLFDIEQKIAMTGVTTPASQVKGGETLLEQRRQEIQLLRRTPGIQEIALLDPQGKEYLRVARRTADVVRSGRDFSEAEFFLKARSGRPFRSPVYFRDDGLYMITAMAVGPDGAGITVAEVDLEFLLAGISRVKVGDAGHAYAVDASGRLIAHPDIGMVLKNTSFAALPQVRQAIMTTARDPAEPLHSHDLAGADVLTAFGMIPQLGWFVFVEEPLATAYRPLYIQVIRSALLALAGILLTLFASVYLVRKMIRPIHALQQGVALIGGGMLEHRIEVNTGDEFETLADGFNRMAVQLQASYAMLERKVEERTRELEESNNKLAALSTTDALTGIANRRRFDEVLASEWNRATRSGQPLALGMLDVDWFKNYNDHYGHQAGDDCLRRVATVLSTCICRTGDLVARYGGEEFVFIAPATDGESALCMAQKVIETIENLTLPHAVSEFGCLTASIGVAAMVPEGGKFPADLISAADQAMYHAKQQGRNRAARLGS